jgi:hypothetical protein
VAARGLRVEVAHGRFGGGRDAGIFGSAVRSRRSTRPGLRDRTEAEVPACAEREVGFRPSGAQGELDPAGLAYEDGVKIIKLK